MRLSHLILLAGSLTLAACGDSDSDAGSTGGAFESSELARPIVVQFADNVVVPTYELLATRLEALKQAVSALKADPTAATLEAAQQAWVDARAPWEMSEGFLFGPVDAQGFDPALDSWPVDRSALDTVLGSRDDLTQSYVSSLDDTLQGFHTAEYLLFGAAADQTAEALDARTLTYLESVVSEMADLSAQLATAWTEGPDAYATLVREAGEPDNTVYPSLQSMAQEIVYGMVGILDEVANGKIADPFSEGDTRLVESQFSHNSLLDFADNIRSVQNAYLGQHPETGSEGACLSDFVKSQDAALDTRITDSIQAAIDAIMDIPAPFRDAITDSAAAGKIEEAQTRIRAVQTLLEGEVLPMINQ